MASKHPLHETIGQLLDVWQKRDGRVCSLIRDPACGDNEGMKQCIPLFCVDSKSAANRLCNVDLLIVCDNKIRVIAEIEESNIKPTQIAGKFLIAALASHFIHRRHNGGSPIPKGDRVSFIQFVDTSKLAKGSKKQKQCENIREAIQSNLPFGRICAYNLIYGKPADFENGGGRLQEVFDAISNAMKP